MKKLIVLLFVAVLVIGTVSAEGISESQNETNSQNRNERRRDATPQVRNERQREANSTARETRQREVNTVTVDGTLKLENGFVAVQSGDSVYLVPMLNRYIGFINGLREGTRVSVEGRGFRNFIHPTTVTIDGTAYNFAAPVPTAHRGPNITPNGGNFNNRQNMSPDRRNYLPGRNNAPSRNNAPAQRNVPRCCR
ncbi:MAG: hypothetical protein LBI28_12225 [Treponema sp.]|nr:hypothetical protein [Treponema sp.]